MSAHSRCNLLYSTSDIKMATKYELSLHAAGLPKGFLWRRPMPYAVVMTDHESKTLGRTEMTEPTLTPDFCVSMKLEFNASIHVPFTVALYDGRGHQDRLIAKADFEATEVYNSPGHTQMKEDRNGTRIHADIQEAVQGPYKGYIKLHFRGLDIKNVEPGLLGLGRSDPFFEIFKKNVDHSAGIVRWNTVYRSEHIDNHLNPYWEPFSIGLEELCYCDLEWPLKITVFDWEESGSHRPIGEAELTAQTLISRIAVRGNADREKALELFLPERAKLKGLLCVLAADVTLEHGTLPTMGGVDPLSEAGVGTNTFVAPESLSQQQSAPYLQMQPEGTLIQA